MHTATSRRFSLRARLATVFSVLVIVTTMVLVCILFFVYRAQLRQTMRERLLETVGVAALHVNGDDHNGGLGICLAGSGESGGTTSGCPEAPHRGRDV